MDTDEIMALAEKWVSIAIEGVLGCACPEEPNRDALRAAIEQYGVAKLLEGANQENALWKEHIRELEPKAPSPEPVAWIIACTDVDGKGKPPTKNEVDWYIADIDSLPVGTKLYAHPAQPASQEAKAPELTDAELLKIASDPNNSPCSPFWLKDELLLSELRAAALKYARAVLAAQKEKK